jgi:hypothetical protein
MTAKNARTEARGVLVKFARRSAEFQWEIVLIHGGQIFCLYTRQIEIRPRRGQDAGVFTRPTTRGRISESPSVRNGRLEGTIWKSGGPELRRRGEVEARGDRKRGVAGLTGKRQGVTYRYN